MSELWVESEVMKIPWFHKVNRHQAECLLLHGGEEGCYLLRDSSQKTQPYALSVKYQESVRHMGLEKSEEGMQLGRKLFSTPDEFRRHVETTRPILGFDSGVMVALAAPLPREMDLLASYEKTAFTRRAAGPVAAAAVEGLSVDVTTREGPLLKKGQYNPAWKERWFKLRKGSLEYFKTRESTKPAGAIAVTNMRDVVASDADKLFGFNIHTDDRIYLLSSTSQRDRDEWIASIKFKIEHRDSSEPALRGSSSSSRAPSRSSATASRALSPDTSKHASSELPPAEAPSEVPTQAPANAVPVAAAPAPAAAAPAPVAAAPAAPPATSD